MAIWFLFGFMCALVVLFVAAYFKFSALHKAVVRTKLRFDVQRKLRRNLISSLALSASAIPELGKPFAYRLTKLKDQCEQSDTVAKQIAYEAEISKTLQELFMQTAKHPELENDEHFAHLRKSLMGLENRIVGSKRRYNSAVRDYNTLAKVFPLNVMARLLEFAPFEYFDFDKSL